MVWVSLDSEQNWAWEGVPWVHFVDGLVDTILIFLSLKTVMFDVVDELEEEHSHAGVEKLILEGLPAEEEEDWSANGSMDDEVSYHFVVE
jgi:hypothetical protein